MTIDQDSGAKTGRRTIRDFMAVYIEKGYPMPIYYTRLFKYGPAMWLDTLEAITLIGDMIY